MTLEHELNSLVQSGADAETLLVAMRRNGCTKTESIKRLMRLSGMSLAEAKVVVHKSQAWRDVRESHDRFQERLLDDLKGPGDDS